MRWPCYHLFNGHTSYFLDVFSATMQLHRVHCPLLSIGHFPQISSLFCFIGGSDTSLPTTVLATSIAPWTAAAGVGSFGSWEEMALAISLFLLVTEERSRRKARPEMSTATSFPVAVPHARKRERSVSFQPAARRSSRSKLTVRLRITTY